MRARSKAGASTSSRSAMPNPGRSWATASTTSARCRRSALVPLDLTNGRLGDRARGRHRRQGRHRDQQRRGAPHLRHRRAARHRRGQGRDGHQLLRRCCGLAQEFGPALKGRSADGATGAHRLGSTCCRSSALSNFPAHGTFSASKAAAYLAGAVPARRDAAGRHPRRQRVPRSDRRRGGTSARCRRPSSAALALASAIVNALRDGVEDVYPGDVAQEWPSAGATTPRCWNANCAAARKTARPTRQRQERPDDHQHPRSSRRRSSRPAAWPAAASA